MRESEKRKTKIRHSIANMYLWANTELRLAPTKGLSKANKPAANIVLSAKKTQATLEYHHLHVFIVPFMKLLFVANIIVGNAI